MVEKPDFMMFDIFHLSMGKIDGSVTMQGGLSLYVQDGQIERCVVWCVPFCVTHHQLAVSVCSLPPPRFGVQSSTVEFIRAPRFLTCYFDEYRHT